uniref:Uncharacterized protein n=1 Tax=Ochrobactrum phage ORM_20 TaxID=2985243 RepID=A0A9N6WS21_9VIRU|nr:hypothetical protein ORM20_00087 [Ochrobactrum phage ORM_20]
MGKPYNRIEAAFEEFKEVLEEIHMHEGDRAYWNKYLDDRIKVYLRPSKQTLEEYLESIKNVKGIFDYRMVEEPTGEISIYIRSEHAIKPIDIQSTKCKDWNFV